MRTPVMVAVPLLVVITVAGCASPLVGLYDRKEVRFTDVSDLAASSAPDLVDAVVPEDATSIATAYYTDKPGDILSFNSAVGPADCTAGPLTGHPLLEASWWPGEEPAEGQVCDHWQFFAVGTTWYAWTN